MDDGQEDEHAASLLQTTEPDGAKALEWDDWEVRSMASMSAAAPHEEATEKVNRGYDLKGAIPFFTIHLLGFAAIWTGVTVDALILCAVLYVVRMWAVTAGYHRYFAHRSYKTSRVFQFFLAFLAQTSAQKGALWWAAHHRTHHKFSDKPGDKHSPVQSGFWYSHLGWLFDWTQETDFRLIRDFTKYPELMLLNRFGLWPAAILGVSCYLAMGWVGLVVGFFWSTILLWHGTFCINSLAHVIGKRRFQTTDESRNHLGLALITLGEGWHNNHHYYQSSARQGFYWWEIDITYGVLKVLSWFGIVWDLRPVPKRVLDEGRGYGRGNQGVASRKSSIRS